jgi:thiamine-monophosphate kinase
VRAFAKGLADDQRAFGISLLGGDTTRASGGLTVTITAIGCVPKGRMVHRAGAKTGDQVFVSGTIGDAALGLGIRLGTLEAPKAAAAYLRDRYLNPQPRTALAPLIRRFASSAMDVSDGLVGDLAHICEASGVGAEIEAGQVPLSRQARAVIGGNGRTLGMALTSGDDYEILATVTKSRAGRFQAAARSAGVPVARIGRIVEGSGPPAVLGPEGRPMAFSGLGHTHF